MRAIVLAAVVVALQGCGGDGGTESALSGAPLEVLEALKIPENPYYIIYSPPVDLAKRPAAR